MKRIPQLSRHATGMGVVRLDGVDHYSKGCSLWSKGRPAPEDITQWYDRITAEWVASGRAIVRSKDPTVATLAAAFLKAARSEYQVRQDDGNDELLNFKASVTHLLKIYATLPASQFSPKKLKAVRQAMIDAGLARSTVNQRTRRIKRIFAWAVEEELLAGTVHHSLTAVKGVRKGKTQAREPEKIKPASMELVRKVIKASRPEIQAMIKLQLYTGMRPGEVCRMTPARVDRSRKIWVYRPRHHKTEHHGEERCIYLGKKAQEVLAPWLLRSENHFCFQTARPRWGATRNYKTRSYHHYIEQVCKRLKIESWSPNQLRHNAGTRFRRRLGLEVSRVLLGHKKVETTQIYAEVDRRKALRAVKKLG